MLAALGFPTPAHLNPLRGNLVHDLLALERYPWTGHAALCGRVSRSWQATTEILARFAGQPRRARAAYRAFVAAGVAQGRRPDLQGGGLVRIVGGWRAVRDLRRGREAYQADERVLGSSAFVGALLEEAERQERARTWSRRRPLELDTLVQRVGKSLGLSPEAVAGRSRVGLAPQARQLVAYLWVERLGRPASHLARAWGWSRGHAAWAAKRGAEAAQAWRPEIDKWCL